MSSFRKRNVQKPITGTRTSPHSGQVITSSGNPSLDLLLGGGLPLGSICLIEEDKYVTHSKVLAKYFLAEGVESQHFVFLGSLDDDPIDLLHKLPKPLNEEETEKECAETAQDEAKSPQNGLRIAWRYNDLPLVNSEQSSIKIGHHFNLLEQMNPLLLEFAETATWNDNPQSSMMDDDNADEDEKKELHSSDTASANTSANSDIIILSKDDVDVENVRYGDIAAGGDATEAMNSDSESTTRPQPNDVARKDVDIKLNSLPQEQQQKPSIFANAKYMRLLREIQPLLREDKFNGGPGISLGCQKSLCRVCITSLGSPLWYDSDFEKDILKFLTVLRAAVRSSMAVCFVTMPMHLVAKLDENLVSKIRNLVDFAIELESFAGSERETNPVYKDYSGLLHLHRIAAINTLSAYSPETKDLAFKLRRKKFVIEKLHLPPELQNNNEVEAASASADILSAPLGCSSGGGAANSSPKAKASLDF